VEICEIRDHPFMIGSQFHPEFRSRPNRPHPLFSGFIAAAVQRSLSREAPAAAPAATAHRGPPPARRPSHTR
jgi:hypothetical protein